MSIWKNQLSNEVIELIRSRSRLGVKRHDPFLTLLLVAALRNEVKVICVNWDD